MIQWPFILDVEVIDPAAAMTTLDPKRTRLLAEMAEPISAATLAARVVEGALPHALLRVDTPLPGIAAPIVYTMDDRVMTSLGICLYGDDAPAVAAREDPAWQAWMKRRFPPPETKETT